MELYPLPSCCNLISQHLASDSFTRSIRCLPKSSFFDDVEDKVMVGLGVVLDTSCLGEVLFYQIQYGHLSASGNNSILNIPLDLLLLFP